MYFGLHFKMDSAKWVILQLSKPGYHIQFLSLGESHAGLGEKQGLIIGMFVREIIKTQIAVSVAKEKDGCWHGPNYQPLAQGRRTV